MKSWAVQDAKARFSELLRAADKAPQTITYRGAPAYEIRKIDPALQGKKRKTFLEVLQSCPKVPEFELPERTFEAPRKIFDDEE
jgi:antitoxin (DNA-binding transcriptional repressor) of toxin-antitoxin stability system